MRNKILKTLPYLGLTNGSDFNDSALWHARITGCIAQAGIKSRFRVETGRRFHNIKHFKTRFNYQDFLNLYYELYNKYIGKDSNKNHRQTEVDIIYLNPQDNTGIGLCEYENDIQDVKENILKFYALHTSNPLIFNPKFCILSYFDRSIYKIQQTEKDIIDLIKVVSGSSDMQDRSESQISVKPLDCHWLLFGIHEDAGASIIKCASTLLDQKAAILKKKKTTIGELDRSLL